MQRLINLLFAIAFVLTFGLLIFAATGALASVEPGANILRKTAVLVNGLACTGSGSIIEGKSGNRYILTNAHVCNCARYKGELEVTFEGGELVRGKVVKQDWFSDLCAAKIDEPRPALKIGKSLPPMTEVNTRGYPGGHLAESHGRVKGRVEWNVAFGIEDLGECPAGSLKGYGLNGNLQACQFHFTSTLTSLYARPGSSGSAVVNDQGQLVGVISSFHPGDDYDAGIVPFADVRRFVEGL